MSCTTCADVSIERVAMQVVEGHRRPAVRLSPEREMQPVASDLRGDVACVLFLAGRRDGQVQAACVLLSGGASTGSWRVVSSGGAPWPSSTTSAPVDGVSTVLLEVRYELDVGEAVALAGRGAGPLDFVDGSGTRQVTVPDHGFFAVCGLAPLRRIGHRD